MKTYVGIDLHSTNCYFAVVDENGKRLFHKRIKNSKEAVMDIISRIESYGEISSLAVESTYNWYWIVDLLQENAFNVKLANPSQIIQYSGKKVTTDKSDAYYLAELLRLNLIPECSIYPLEYRSLRDLLRSRGFLVEKRTSFKNSLTTKIARLTGVQLRGEAAMSLEWQQMKALISDKNNLHEINQLRSHILSLTNSIKQIEKIVMKQVKPNANFKNLDTVPGIGNILALTIILETGSISRFPKSGNYTSYCRLVDSVRTSNGKVKGMNNKKNGNKYLCWAYSEAAIYAVRYYDGPKRYWQRKERKANKMLAYKSLAAKLSKACFYMMRDNTVFDEIKMFGYKGETSRGAAQAIISD